MEKHIPISRLDSIMADVANTVSIAALIERRSRVLLSPKRRRLQHVTTSDWQD
jgi:hypothetical protein